MEREASSSSKTKLFRLSFIKLTPKHLQIFPYSSYMTSTLHLNSLKDSHRFQSTTRSGLSSQAQRSRTRDFTLSNTLRPQTRLSHVSTTSAVIRAKSTFLVLLIPSQTKFSSLSVRSISQFQKYLVPPFLSSQVTRILPGYSSKITQDI